MANVSSFSMLDMASIGWCYYLNCLIHLKLQLNIDLAQLIATQEQYNWPQYRAEATELEGSDSFRF